MAPAHVQGYYGREKGAGAAFEVTQADEADDERGDGERDEEGTQPDGQRAEK